MTEMEEASQIKPKKLTTGVSLLLGYAELHFSNEQEQSFGGGVLYIDRV